MDSTTDKKDCMPMWNYVKVLAVGALIGFSIGLYVDNIMYTKRLMEDCETMKQFRIGKLAYDCKVK